METTSGKAKLIKWGNGQGVRLTKKEMEQLDLHIGSELVMEIQMTPTGKKQLVITEEDTAALESPDEKLAMLNSLHGLLADTAVDPQIEIKAFRRNRRLKKYTEGDN